VRTSAPRLIGSGLSSVIEELGIGLKIRQHELLHAWPGIVGEQIARVTTATALSDGKLFVSVTRSTWRNELIFLKKELIEKINAAMNSDIVKDIIFR
jgi:predicted nucleic acid-binding Zn ribbon protein